MEHGYSVHFEDCTCEIYDKDVKHQVVAKITMEGNRNFPLNFQYAWGVALKMNVQEDSWLWHRKYGHLNFQNLKCLHDKNKVYGLPNV